MATTATEILARVQALGYGTDVESAQLIMLNSAHKRIINARRWSFLFASDSSKTLTVGSGSLTYDALAATRRIDAVRLELGTSYLELDSLSQQEFRALEHRERVNGPPEYWTREGETIHFWPFPDQAYKVVVDYITNPTNITASATNVQIPDSHADILVWAIIMQITFRERDWDGHNFARQMYAELYAEMMAQYGMTDRQTAKRVQSSDFYAPYELTDPWLLP